MSRERRSNVRNNLRRGEPDSGRGRSTDAPEQTEHELAVSAGVGLAQVTLFGQDSDLRYLWVENPHEGCSIDEIWGFQDEELLPPDVAAVLLPVKREAMATKSERSVEYQMTVGGVQRWFELRIAPRLDPTGKVVGIVGANIDISDRKQSESHLRVLLLELAHRSKNLLAVIQGIANQTAQSSSSIDEFGRRFSGRLMSLSRAHDILSDQNWRGAGMRELIRTQVLLFAGHATERITYDGDAVYLRPSAAQHVGLALYELTANAIKHGALSSKTGKIAIRWSRKGEDEFQLAWTESEGPTVASPQTRHFGRILLEEVVPFAVQGSATLDFTKSGILYRLTMPASELN